MSDSLSSATAAAARDHLVAAALRLIERGDEPTMRAVAIEASVAERTVYRYFGARDGLAEALLPTLRARASAPLPDDAAALPAYAERLMRTFAAHPQLNRALLTTAWMRAHFPGSRGQNLRDLQRLLDAAFPTVPVAVRSTAAAALRAALSGSTWLYLADAGLDEDAIAAQARWNAETMLAELARRAVPGRRRAAPRRQRAPAARGSRRAARRS